MARHRPWTGTGARGHDGGGGEREGMPLSGADAAGECIYVRPSRELAGVMFMVVNGTIARVDVSTGDVATEEGVRVGDSNESVREFYAGRVTASPHKYTDGQYLTIAPDA